jgi:hypothetical protein
LGLKRQELKADGLPLNLVLPASFRSESSS